MSLKPAAFFRVEGPIVPSGAVAAAAWLAANSQEIGLRLGRLGAVALSAPAALGADPTTAVRIAWMSLRGMSEDRLVVLGEEYFATRLRGAIRPVGQELLARARREGQRVVLVSELLHPLVAPLADHLGADVLVCNRMELRAGRATGRLVDPVVGRLGGSWLREVAADHALDLSRSTAYGARDADLPLLSAVGQPCAVHPDRSLRSAARDLDWPVVEAP